MTVAKACSVRNGKRVCTYCLTEPVARHSLCSSKACGCECRESETVRGRLVALEAEERQKLREKAGVKRGSIDHLLGDDDDQEEEVVVVKAPAPEPVARRVPPAPERERPRPIPVREVPVRERPKSEVVWCDPPPRSHGRQRIDWMAILGPLRERPGEWARVRAYPGGNGGNNDASRLRKGQHHPLPPGRWKFQGGRVKDEPGIRSGLWACYLGGD